MTYRSPPSASVSTRLLTRAERSPRYISGGVAGVGEYGLPPAVPMTRSNVIVCVVKGQGHGPRRAGQEGAGQEN